MEKDKIKKYQQNLMRNNHNNIIKLKLIEEFTIKIINSNFIGFEIT